MADTILSLPPWSGSTFVARGPKHNGHIPEKLDPPSVQLPKPFTSVITGAGRGIGAGIARAFAAAGATGLLLTARKAQDIEATKKACLERSQLPDGELKVVCLSADNAQEQSAMEVREAIERGV